MAHTAKRRRRTRNSEAEAYRSLYRSPLLQRLRRQAFLRDGYTFQRTGALCTGRGQHPYAPVAHHKVPRKGDPALFFELDNIETVVKCTHDALIQKEEAKGYVIGSDIEGRPLAPDHRWNRQFDAVKAPATALEPDS